MDGATPSDGKTSMSPAIVAPSTVETILRNVSWAMSVVNEAMLAIFAYIHSDSTSKGLSSNFRVFVSSHKSLTQSSVRVFWKCCFHSSGKSSSSLNSMAGCRRMQLITFAIFSSLPSSRRSAVSQDPSRECSTARPIGRAGRNEAM